MCEQTQEYTDLWKRYLSGQEVLDQQASRIEFLEKALEIAEREKKQWVSDKMVQQQIIAQQLTSSDEVARSLQNELISVKAIARAALKNKDWARLKDIF